MVLNICDLSSLGISAGIGLLIGFILLAFFLFRSGRDTSWFKYPSLSVLIVSTALIVWQFVGCDEQMMWVQLISLLLLGSYLLLAIMHQSE